MDIKKVERKDCWFSLPSENKHFKIEKSEEKGVYEFSGVAYSGKPIMNHPYWGNLIFDIETMESKDTVPILRDHRTDREAGHGQLSFENNQVIVKGFLYGDEGEKAYKLMKKGFPMQESVYIEPKRIEKIFDGQTFVYNGQTVEGEMTVFVGGKIKEVSLVTLGADENTSTKVFNNNEGALEVPFYERKEMIKKEEIENKVDQKNEDKFSDEYTGFLEAMNVGVEEAYKFACDCAEKKSQSSVEKLKNKIKELENKIAEFEKEKAESKKASKIVRIEESFKDSILPDSVKSILVEANEDKFEALLSDMMALAVKKEEVKKELFEEDGQESHSLSFSESRQEYKNSLLAQGKSLAEAHFLTNKKFGK